MGIWYLAAYKHQWNSTGELGILIGVWTYAKHGNVIYVYGSFDESVCVQC